MKLILISFYLAIFCNKFFLDHKVSESIQLKTPYDSTKIVLDSIPNKGAYLGPSIEVQIKYNFVLLDKFVVGNIERMSIIDNKPANKTFIYPAGSVVSLVPTDKSIATESMYIKFDSAPEKRYYEPIRLSAKGNHKLVIKLRDQWGGEMISDSVNFKVLPY